MDTVLFDCCFDIFATPSAKCEPWHLIPSVKKDSNLESVLLAKLYLLFNSVFLFKFMYFAYKKVHLRAGLVHSMIQSLNTQPFFIVVLVLLPCETETISCPCSCSKKNHVEFGDAGRCNMHIIGTAFLSSIPVLGAQTVAALVTLLSDDQDNSSPSGIFLSIHTSHKYECDGSMREDHQDG